MKTLDDFEPEFGDASQGVTAWNFDGDIAIDCASGVLGAWIGHRITAARARELSEDLARLADLLPGSTRGGR